jgi:hypothetical protein
MGPGIPDLGHVQDHGTDGFRMIGAEQRGLSGVVINPVFFVQNLCGHQGVKKPGKGPGVSAQLQKQAVCGIRLLFQKGENVELGCGQNNPACHKLPGAFENGIWRVHGWLLFDMKWGFWLFVHFCIMGAQKRCAKAVVVSESNGYSRGLQGKNQPLPLSRGVFGRGKFLARPA